LVEKATKEWIVPGDNAMSHRATDAVRHLAAGDVRCRRGVHQWLGNGIKTFQYNSANIANALNHIGSLQRLRNGWTDTRSSYS
jgi:hypothetical protein